MKLNKLIKTCGAGCGVLVAIGLAYQVGRGGGNDEIADLRNQISQLEQKEQDAAVVKRVGQQMENIAYQQMDVSNKQRDRAEAQSLLATQNASKAMAALREAELQKNEAEKQRGEAEAQREHAQKLQEIAENQRDEVAMAKSISDTLNYRSLSRSLGSAALAHFEAKDDELAQLLAYASWYFIHQYNGNTYQAETYKALVAATESNQTGKSLHGGVITDIDELADKSGVVYVTSYGDVELWQGNKIRTLFSDKNYDFRGVAVRGSDIYALTCNKGILIMPVSGAKISTTIPLPANHYSKMTQTGDRDLILATNSSVSWFDMDSKSVINYKVFPEEVTAFVDYNGEILVFFKNGTSGVLDRSGKFAQNKLVPGKVITAAYIDPKNGCIFLGSQSGDIYMLNKYHRLIATLNGHKAGILCLGSSGNVLLSCSFDKTMQIWNLDKCAYESGYSFQDELKMKTIVKRPYSQGHINSEWLTPVSYSSSSWPLAMYVDATKDVVWTGLSDGTISQAVFSTDKMSSQLYSKLKRNMTKEEWNQYVGSNIPYVKFK